MDILQQITVNLPNFPYSFKKQFLTFLSPFGDVDENSIIFQNSLPFSSPLIEIVFTDRNFAHIDFKTTTNLYSTRLQNTSGVVKQSPHSYTPITLDEFTTRIKNVELGNVDHIGFNLPWMKGVHPEIAQLRKELKNTCLYHLFPTGEDWDFIIPGTKEEIVGENIIDYSQKRKPKFELVSIAKTSTPLVQIDIDFKTSYQNLAKLFPEGILMMDYKFVWVYIKNEYDFDLCFVLNEKTDEDWSEFFKDTRLK